MLSCPRTSTRLRTRVLGINIIFLQLADQVSGPRPQVSVFEQKSETGTRPYCSPIKPNVTVSSMTSITIEVITTNL